MLCWKFAVWSIASIRINQCNWRWDFKIIPRIVNGAGKKPDVGWFVLDCGYWKARNDREYNHYTYTNGFYKVARSQGKGPCRVPKAFPKRQHEAIHKKWNSRPARDCCKIPTRLVKKLGQSLASCPPVGNAYQLKLTKNVKQPVPAVDFANNIARVDGLFNQEQNMHVTPIEYFTSRYREFFTNTKQALDKERGKGTAGWAKHEI